MRKLNEMRLTDTPRPRDAHASKNIQIGPKSKNSNSKSSCK